MKVAHIIILAGQSNAVGVGYVKYISKHFSPEKTAEFMRGYSNPAINYFSHDIKSGGFVDTRVCCAERSKETFGPEIGIAEQLSARYPGEDMFIVKCAVGATSMYEHWHAPDGSCYTELVSLLGESIKLLEARGYTPRVRAFCWMQGESDACTEEHAEQYIGLYDAMLRELRGAFEPYFTDCVYIDATVSSKWKYYEELNRAKVAYSRTSDRFRSIDTIGAGLSGELEPEEAPDTIHYDSESVIRLGRLFAEHIEL